MVQEGLGNHSFGESGALSVELLATEQHRKTGVISMAPGRLGRGLRGGKGLEIPIPMELSGEGHWQCLQWGWGWLYPFSHALYSVLFTFSLHMNAEEKKTRAWVAPPWPLHREHFSSCFTPKMTSGCVTSSHPTAALEPSLPFGCSVLILI